MPGRAGLHIGPEMREPLGPGAGMPNGLSRCIASGVALAEACAVGAAPRYAADTASGAPSASRVLIHSRVTVGPDHDVIRLTLYPADMTAVSSDSRVAQGRPSNASCRMAYSG
jgi:hypothetical protein